MAIHIISVLSRLKIFRGAVSSVHRGGKQLPSISFGTKTGDFFCFIHYPWMYEHRTECLIPELNFLVSSRELHRLPIPSILQHSVEH